MSANAPASDTTNAEIQRRLAKLSAYKQAEYHCVEGIAALREGINKVLELENQMGVPGGPVGHNNNNNSNGKKKKKDYVNNAAAAAVGSRVELARARQAVRRAEQQLQKLSKAAQRAARNESGGVYDADIKELLRHVESARKWYRECFRVVLSNNNHEELSLSQSVGNEQYGVGGVDVSNSNSVNNNNSGGSNKNGNISHFSNREAFVDLATPLLSAEGNRNDVDLRRSVNVAAVAKPTISDEEFCLFVSQIQKNDNIGDVFLDRISAGLTRIHENAVTITSELKTQEEILDDVEEKVDTTRVALSGLNAQLRKLLKGKNRCDFFMYAFCFSLFICVVIAIVILIKS